MTMDDPARRVPAPSRSPAPAGALAVPTANDRERVVQALSTLFANDGLSMDEFESRLERAYKAVSVEQLTQLLADLPAVGASGVVQGPATRLAPAGEVPARGVVIAVMGGNGRRGSWLVPRHLKVFALMGGAEIDLREARFAAGVTEIEAYAVMGAVKILVPPEVRVETVGVAIMGGFEGHAGDATALSPLHPIIRLSGLAVMGGVEAKTKPLGQKGTGRKKRGESSRPDQDL
jgi:hypothetical protein